MKKMSFIFLTAIFLLLFHFSCNNIDDGPTGPPSEVKVGDELLVNFPPGSIKSQKVTLNKVKDPNIEYVFDETADLFGVKDILPNQIILNIGEFPPQNDSIKLSIVLPESFTNTIPNNYGIEIFALIYQDGGDEVLDLFDIIPSSYNSSTKTLTSLLPTWVFTNQRTSDNTYEAIFIIGTTPGENINKGGRLDYSGLRMDGVQNDCKAGQILCPLGSMDLCNTQKTSGFSKRKDPITGKDAIHWGIDYGISVGTPINGVADGNIEKVWTQKDTKGNIAGYGLYVVLRHTNGAATLYAHLSETSVKVGDPIKEGEVIGKSGNSGKSSGPHLHFEYVPNGQIVLSKERIDPEPCISEGNAEGSITIRDNGNIADDAFELYLDDILIGRTDIGASNSIALSNLRPGDKNLKLVCIIAPDDVGTYEILLQDGIVFKDDGSDIKSDILPQGGAISWPITIPKTARLSASISKMQPNEYIEK